MDIVLPIRQVELSKPTPTSHEAYKQHDNTRGDLGTEKPLVADNAQRGDEAAEVSDELRYAPRCSKGCTQRLEEGTGASIKRAEPVRDGEVLEGVA